MSGRRIETACTHDGLDHSSQHLEPYGACVPPQRSQQGQYGWDAASDESVPSYFARWDARFGLDYFGCCDPLNSRIDSVRKILNVRNISMSPWAKIRQAAEAVGPDFVFSRKPTPRWSR